MRWADLLRWLRGSRGGTTREGPTVHVCWERWRGKGFEYARLSQSSDGSIWEGTVLGVRDGHAFELRYAIDLDPLFRTRAVRLEVHPGRNRLWLFASARRVWTDHIRTVIPGLKGCSAVQISATPLTETLSLSRLRPN